MPRRIALLKYLNLSEFLGPCSSELILASHQLITVAITGASAPSPKKLPGKNLGARPEASTARGDIVVEPFGDTGIAARGEAESDVDRRDYGPVNLFRPHLVPIDCLESASD
jgi:hypothetical protein